MSWFSGLHIPEAIGFGILGATIGAAACELTGGQLASHVGLGIAAGAVLFVGLAALPVKRAAKAMVRSRIDARPSGDRRMLPH